MKKVCFLISIMFVFIFSGILSVNASTIKYDLEITEDKSFVETITYTLLNFQNISNGYNYQDKVYGEMQAFYNDDSINYTKNLTQNGNDYVISFSYAFTERNFENSYILNSCFESFNFTSLSDSYSFKSTGEFYCKDLKDLVISVKSYYPIISTNAQKTSDGLYEWIISGEAQTFNISISKDLNYTPPINDNNRENVSTSKKTITVIIAILSILLLIGLGIYNITRKKNNKI